MEFAVLWRARRRGLVRQLSLLRKLREGDLLPRDLAQTSSRPAPPRRRKRVTSTSARADWTRSAVQRLDRPGRACPARRLRRRDGHDDERSRQTDRRARRLAGRLARADPGPGAAIIHEALPGVEETWKRRGTPVWEQGGMICTGETYKAAVKLDLRQGRGPAGPRGPVQFQPGRKRPPGHRHPRGRGDRRRGARSAGEGGGGVERGEEEVGAQDASPPSREGVFAAIDKSLSIAPGSQERAGAHHPLHPRANEGHAAAVTEDRDIGLPARRAAIDIVSSALSRRAGVDEALTRPGFRNLGPRDRGFAMALAMATLRRLGAIELALDARLAKPPPEGVRNILRDRCDPGLPDGDAGLRGGDHQCRPGGQPLLDPGLQGAGQRGAALPAARAAEAGRPREPLPALALRPLERGVRGRGGPRHGRPDRRRAGHRPVAEERRGRRAAGRRTGSRDPARPDPAHRAQGRRRRLARL